MGPTDILGYVAGALVLATFTMRTIIPLRMLGIASNIAFMAYGLASHATPIFILHAILLPLNLYRLYEMRRLVVGVRGAAGGRKDLDWLVPFMERMPYRAGAVLFRKGDPADALFYLAVGTLRVVEIDVSLESGSVVGEIGLFAPGALRTATVECATDCEVLRIMGAKVRELFLQNPEFGFYLVGVVTERLVHNQQRLEQELATSVAERSLPQ